MVALREVAATLETRADGAGNERKAAADEARAADQCLWPEDSPPSADSAISCAPPAAALS